MNDVIRFAMERAARRFGGSDGLFNAAGFSAEMSSIAGLSGSVLDGRMVRALLCGRTDVVPMHGGAHYRLVTE